MNTMMYGPAPGVGAQAHLQLYNPHVPLINLPLLLVNGTIHVMHVVVVALCCQLQVGYLNRP